MNNLGYCCICLGINDKKSKKEHVLVNRGMIKKTFESKGLEYVSELSILNLNDLSKIIDYNIKNNIYVYRMSSDMFPWLTHYDIKKLPKFNIIENILKRIGQKIISNNIRVSFHAPPFCVIASENENVVKNSIDELNKHSEIMDIMGLEQNTYYPINVHINSTKPNREIASDRFCNQYNNLSESCKKRLTVENDDSINQYSVKYLYDNIYKRISIPIVFDQHHFKYGTQEQNIEESLKTALSTWKTKPLTHISSSKCIEDSNSTPTAHADFIYDEILTFNMEFDIEIEAKKKDLALLRYRKEFLK